MVKTMTKKVLVVMAAGILACGLTACQDVYKRQAVPLPVRGRQ